MPHESIVAPVLLVLVLLVLALWWAKKKWMSKSVTLSIVVRGGTAKASGSNWTELVERLVVDRNNLSESPLFPPCNDDEVWDAISDSRSEVAKKLVEHEAWEMLAEFWGPALEARALKMLNRENWKKVAELLPLCGASTRARLVEGMRKVIRDQDQDEFHRDLELSELDRILQEKKKRVEWMEEKQVQMVLKRRFKKNEAQKLDDTSRGIR